MKLEDRIMKFLRLRRLLGKPIDAVIICTEQEVREFKLRHGYDFPFIKMDMLLGVKLAYHD